MNPTINLFSICVLFALAGFQYTEGLKCITCTYTNFAGNTTGDPRCESGVSDLVGVAECAENNPALKLNSKLKLACVRIDTDTQVGSQSFSAVRRMCGLSLEDSPGCKTATSQSGLASLRLPFDTSIVSKLGEQTQVNLNTKECSCFTDQCNSANKPPVSVVLIGFIVVWYMFLMSFK